MACRSGRDMTGLSTPTSKAGRTRTGAARAGRGDPRWSAVIHLGSYDQYDLVDIVPIGDEVAVPRYVVTDLDEPSLPYLVRVIVENTTSGSRCVDLRVVARPDGLAVTSAGIRLLPIARILREVERRQIVMHPIGEGAWAAASGEQSRRDRTAYRRAVTRRDTQTRRWLLDEPTLAKVAEVYRTAGSAPTQAVADYFKINRPRAARWVKVARERAHLRPAPGRRMKGER
jgi:hypothetical protein